MVETTFFNSTKAIELTGLSYKQIIYWDTTDFIKPSLSGASGKGTTRLYSFRDLVQLKIAKKLMDNGFSLQMLKQVIKNLKKYMPDIEKPLSELRFMTDGKSIFVMAKDDKAVLDVLKSAGQLVFYIIKFSEIIEELKGDVIKIEQNRRYTVIVYGKQYDIILHPDIKDGGFWVECPELDIASQGDTVEESLDMIKEAMELYLEDTEAQANTAHG